MGSTSRPRCGARRPTTGPPPKSSGPAPAGRKWSFPSSLSLGSSWPWATSPTEALLAHLGLRKRDFPFAHGRVYPLEDGRYLVDSYHVSRQNTQTGRLTRQMFLEVLLLARRLAGL
jgi:hypothetical protein